MRPKQNTSSILKDAFDTAVKDKNTIFVCERYNQGSYLHTPGNRQDSIGYR